MKKLMLVFVFSLLLVTISCNYEPRQMDQQRRKTPVLGQDVDSLFNGVESVIFRHGYDTTSLVYCLTFQNGKRCIVSSDQRLSKMFFYEINDKTISPHKRPLKGEHVFFKNNYGCNITQIETLIFFCWRNKFENVTHYNEQYITLRSSQMTFFYSKDSMFFNGGKYEKIDSNWYVMK